MNSITPLQLIKQDRFNLLREVKKNKNNNKGNHG